MQYFIADDQINQVATLGRLLSAAEPHCKIFPAPPRALNTWADVERELLSETEDSHDLVVILDLSLQPPDMSGVDAGITQASQLRSLRPSATFIAFTQYVGKAQHKPNFDETFDGRIDKQLLSSHESFDAQVTFIRQILSASIRKRRKVAPTYSLKDSMGLRLALAALREEGIDYLVEAVAHDWEHREVFALSSGHSGAFLLAVTGTRNGGPQRIIVKCAMEKKTIEGETRRVKEHLAELGPLGECMAPAEQSLNALPENRGFYYLQAEVIGDTLFNCLSRISWGAQAKALLDIVLTLELRCYAKTNGVPFAKMNSSECFALSPIDVGRATESLQFLRLAGKHCERLDQWPTNVPSIEKVAEDMQRVLDFWSENLGKTEELFVAAQHGDLNLSNVIIPNEGRAVLIDFSRLGPWPVGYDIARLATMCRMQLTDAQDERHWIENRLLSWLSEEFCIIDIEIEVDSAISPWAQHCDQRFRAYLQGLNEDEKRRIRLGYRLGTLWDLIKVLSYSDLPIFKRIWALISCWRLAQQIGFIK